MEDVRNAIRDYEIEEAIRLLLERSSYETESDIRLISARYIRWKKNQMMGLDNPKEEINQIVNALLAISDTIQKSYIEERKYQPKLIRKYLIEKPTPEKPLLIGILVDVSASMLESFENKDGNNQNRLQSFQNSMEDLVKSAKQYCLGTDGKTISPLFKIFVYGFGFGNMLSILLKGQVEKVKSLILPKMGRDVLTVNELVEDWENSKKYVTSLINEMFGNTPMYEALKIAKAKITQEKQKTNLTFPIILFIVSDGEPSDAQPSQILDLIEDVKKENVLIVSVFLTDKNITQHKKLYSNANSDWSIGAKLMFNSASTLPPNSPFYDYLQEFNWEFGENPKMFAQVNHSDTLREFINIILSPLKNNS